jgi:activator of HSP90 ATPase
MIKLKTSFPVKPKIIYDAWLNSEEHSKMTGSTAVFTKEIGGLFTAWDGYISGKNVALTPNREIIQEWRTTEFSDEQASSKLTIHLEEAPKGCELTLTHTNIPSGQSDYEKGWTDFYFTPMREYFG